VTPEIKVWDRIRGSVVLQHGDTFMVRKALARKSLNLQNISEGPFWAETNHPQLHPSISKRLPGMSSLDMPHWQRYMICDQNQRKCRSRFSIQGNPTACPFPPNASISIPLFTKAQSIVIRLDTGPCLRSGSSVMLSIFSSSEPILRFRTCCLSPLLKLAMQNDALMIVRTIKMIVRTAKLVRFLRTGK